MDPDLEASESIKRASVVIDCTSNGWDMKIKLNFIIISAKMLEALLLKGVKRILGKICSWYK